MDLTLSLYVPISTDCFLAAQQHHGPGAVLRHLLQVRLSYVVYFVQLLLTGLGYSVVLAPADSLGATRCRGHLTPPELSSSSDADKDQTSKMY